MYKNKFTILEKKTSFVNTTTRSRYNLGWQVRQRDRKRSPGRKKGVHGEWESDGPRLMAGDRNEFELLKGR